MATDIEKLVVQLSADFRSYENAMAKASGITRKQMAAIKAEAEAAGYGSAAAFTGASKGVQRFGSEAKRAQASVSALRAQTGNLASQFQDVAVQLQMGQSPFQVALQQGTQISAVLGGQGARGAVTALAGAFASLISPVSLVTIGLIAAGGAAVQYFASLLSEGEKSAEELKQQAALIQQVAKDWGDAVPAIRAYAAEVERASKAAELTEAGQIINEKLYGDARQQVENLSLSLVALRGELEAFASREQVADISALQKAFNNLQTATEENRATAADADAVQAALAKVMDLGGQSAIMFANDLSILSGSLTTVATVAARAASDIATAQSAMQTFRAAEAKSMRNLALAEGRGQAAIAEQERKNSLTAEQLALESEIESVKSRVAASGGIVNPDDARRVAEQTLAAEKARAEAPKAAKSSAGGRKSAASEVDRERESVAKMIEQLEFEQTQIGKTAEEREVANALRRAGAAATEEDRVRIEGLVRANYDLAEAVKAQEDQFESLQALSRDVLGGMFEDMRNGAKGADLLANALNRVAESLVSAGIDNLTSAIGGNSGGGAGGIFGAIASLLTGRREQGGPVRAGGAYLVGEKRPEIFVPKQSGFIIPRVPRATAAPVPSSSGGSVDVRVYVDRDGNWQAAVERISGGVAGQVVRREAAWVVAEANERGR